MTKNSWFLHSQVNKIPCFHNTVYSLLFEANIPINEITLLKWVGVTVLKIWVPYVYLNRENYSSQRTPALSLKNKHCFR